ncbi:MAG: tetratricopeptide repeat protein [Candidatus Aminicenantes bacterium]|nr:tetratricopeptide repeat protein [Candidatus Aminicenantes bacterium]
MKAILPAALVLLTVACGGVRPVTIDFHLPTLESGTFIDSYFRQGWEQLRNGDSEAAYRSFQLSEAPLDKKQAAFGYVFLARKKFSAAAAQFDQALEANPDNLEAGMGRAMVLELEGRMTEAYRAYGRLALQAPADAWINLKYESIRSSATQAHLLAAERARGVDKALYIRELEQAAFFSPDMTSIALQIADHYYDEQQWQRSQPYYEAVLEKEPHNEGVLLKLAALYEKRDKLDLALVTLDRLLETKPGDPVLEAEKQRLRERFQELTLPEKFKNIFFKSEINREELAALVGFYFDRYIRMEGPPVIITDIDGSFAREQIMKTVTAGIMRARPDHTFQRFAAPDRAAFAATLNALIAYLRSQAHMLRFAPPADSPVIADLSPLHKDFQGITFLVRAQILALDAEGRFNPTLTVSPADVIQSLKKILNAIEE